MPMPTLSAYLQSRQHESTAVHCSRMHETELEDKIICARIHKDTYKERGAVTGALEALNAHVRVQELRTAGAYMKRAAEHSKEERHMEAAADYTRALMRPVRACVCYASPTLLFPT